MRLKYLLCNTTNTKRTGIARSICYLASFYHSLSLSYPSSFNHNAITYKRKAINHTSNRMKLSTTLPSNSRLITLHDESKYHKVADRTLEQVIDFLSHLDDINLDDTDVNLSQGVLNISLSTGGTTMSWVINKQTPNRQLWWSSPISGPRRYEWLPDNEDIDTVTSIFTNNNHHHSHQDQDGTDLLLLLLTSWKYNKNTTSLPATSSSTNTTTSTSINTNTLLYQLHKEILQVTGVDLLNIIKK